MGSRIKALRDAQQITQVQMTNATGINQPRLSKLENGRECPSADVIDKIATVLGRSGLQIVSGTDREGFYRAQRLSPEQEQVSRTVERWKCAINVLSVYLIYSRILEMFDALYGGGIVPAFAGEDTYIHLRRQCELLLKEIDVAHPQTLAQIYLPDHFEFDGPDDDLLLAFNEFISADMRRSLRTIREIKADYADLLTMTLEDDMIKRMKLHLLDRNIADMREARIKCERETMKRLQATIKRL
ncbi:MAG: helix-turn-helix domain-containing protein [Vulcanimicrobiaceae bacterium]